MELADRAVGFLLSLISLFIFTYYTFWVIILPLVDDDLFVHKYFLPQEYAILIPVYAGVALICFLCMFVGFVMIKSKKKKGVMHVLHSLLGITGSLFLFEYFLEILFLVENGSSSLDVSFQLKKSCGPHRVLV